VNVEGGIDEMRIIPITLRQGSFTPLVEALGREPKNPAGHRDGNTVSGKIKDQRVHL
jgi:hypothetical protein